MSDRLPTRVMCAACRTVVPTEKARRFITLWARLRKGGSLSGIKDQEAHDTYRCDACIAGGRFEPTDRKREDLFSRLREGRETA